MTGHSGVVGFLTMKVLPDKTVDAPIYSTFENIAISVVIQYHLFLFNFLFFCGFLSSLTSSFITSGDLNVHVDIYCTDKRYLFNLKDIQPWSRSKIKQDTSILSVTENDIQSNKLVNDNWMHCSNIPHPPSFTLFSVFRFRCVIFSRTPFQN